MYRLERLEGLQDKTCWSIKERERNETKEAKFITLF